MRSIAVILVAAVGLISACNTANAPGSNSTNTNANASTANASSANTASAPSKDVLAAREKQAFEAWKNKDGKFFEGFLTGNFVMMDGANHPDKAATVKMIAENPCEVKSYSMSDEAVTNIAPDVAAITMKIEADVTCDGKKMPSPVTGTSVYIREGNEWKGAYHSEVAIVAPNAKPATGTAPPPPAKTTAPANKELAAMLIEREKGAWDAWKAQDRAKLDDFIAPNASAVGMFGERMATKADILKSWTEPCEVKDIKLSDEHAVQISPTVALLLYKGTATGKCGDMDIKPQWATTVYVKEGETWRGAYFVASPA